MICPRISLKQVETNTMQARWILVFLFGGLVGCGASDYAGGRAKVKLFAEDPDNDAEDGYGVVLLADAPVNCASFKLGIVDGDLWRAFEAASGSVYSLQYNLHSPADTVPWLGRYSPSTWDPMTDPDDPGRMVSDYRYAQVSFVQDGVWNADQSGLAVEIKEVSSTGVEFEWRNVWEQGSGKLENCGFWDEDASNDTGWDTGGWASE
jgi:hypothetical protein